MPSLVASIPPPPINGFELGPLDLRFYGLLIAIGAFLALRMATTRYARYGGDGDAAERILLWSLGGGLVGARIGYVIPRVGTFADDPVSALAIWEGGLTIFGGLFLGALVGLWLTRRADGDVAAMIDAVAPALPLAQAIGRWGNYFNQELYGRPTELPWALEIERHARRPGFEGFETFHPTFLYESLWNLTLVLVILRLDRTGRLRRGSLGFVYLIGYGIGRAWIEALRVDTAERYLGLSRNNWIAIACVIVGAIGLWWWQRRAARDTGDEISAVQTAAGPATGETEVAPGPGDTGTTAVDVDPAATAVDADPAATAVDADPAAIPADAGPADAGSSPRPLTDAERLVARRRGALPEHRPGEIDADPGDDDPADPDVDDR